MPPIRDELGGFVLHEIDLAVNKTLALAGRDEPRDFVDILYVHERVLPLSALVRAAVGKDPGFTPLSLVELLRRRGGHRPEDMARLNLATPFDPVASKKLWTEAMDDAEKFARSGPTREIGCLYYSLVEDSFVVPERGVDLETQGLVLHYGSPGGVLARVVES
jgi:hypothetical protein